MSADTKIRQLGKYELDRIALPSNSPREALEFFEAQDKESLAALIVNHVLNDFVSGAEDSESDEPPIPYQGWYWRSVDFFNEGGVTIAEGDGRVAICQNNKWGYPQRDLTGAEMGEFLDRVWAAHQASRKGGQLSQIHEETNNLLAEAGRYIESLKINEEGN